MVSSVFQFAKLLILSLATCVVLQSAQTTALEEGVLTRLASVRERVEDTSTRREDVQEMVMSFVKRPELPERTVGLEERVETVSRRLKDMEGCVLGIVGMGGVGECITHVVLQLM